MVIVTLVLFNILLRSIHSSEWAKNHTFELNSIKGIGFSPDDQFVLGGGYNQMKAFICNPLERVQSIDLGPLAINNVYHSSFSKDQKYVAYVGNTEYGYLTKFPDMRYVSDLTFQTNNNFMNDVDFNFDGSKLISCGNKQIQITRLDMLSLKQFASSVPAPSCEYSDVDDKFGFTQGKSFSVYNADYSLFYTFQNTSMPSSIK